MPTSKLTLHRWLHREVSVWQQQGIIDTEQAQQITQRYPLESLTGSWGKLIFSAIGAVIFGLGVILFFAYNWATMPKALKLLVVFTGIVVAHGLGLDFWRRGKHKHNDRQTKIGESLMVLGTVLYGAGIFLVAQIYHIDEHYPNGILFWSLGALLLAWVLFSTVQALLALFLLAMWHWFEIFDFNQVDAVSHWLIALAILPLAWLKRSQILLFFTCAVFFISFFISSINFNEDVTFTGLMFLAVFAALSAKIAAHSRYADSEGILKAIGTLIYTGLLFAVCFIEVIDDLNIRSYNPSALILYLILPALLMISSLMLLFWRFPEFSKDKWNFSEAILMVVACALILVAAYSDNRVDVLMVVGFNLLFITHAVIFLLRGMREVSWKQVCLGGLMLGAIVFARFLDLFDDLLMRSLAFLLIGAMLFVLGLVFSRRSADTVNRKQVQGDSASGVEF